MTLTQRDVFKRIMTEWLRPPKAIRLLMGYTPKSTVRLWGDAHPKYVPPCPHKNGEFRLIRAFRVTRIASADYLLALPETAALPKSQAFTARCRPKPLFSRKHQKSQFSARWQGD